MAGQKTNLQGVAPITLKAAGTVPAYRTLKLDTNGDVVVTTAITEDVIGVSLKAAASGEYVEVQTAGIAKVTASAAISIAGQVMPGASGKVAASSGATSKSIGIALTASAADLETIEVLLRLGVNGVLNT